MLLLRRAVAESAVMTQSYDLGPYVDEHYSLLAKVVRLASVMKHLSGGIALEFGVGQGTSTGIIARHMPVIGFDSFKGLPEDWREGYPEGMFACDPPDVPNAYFEVGLYDEVLPGFHWAGLRNVVLVHIDCDLYSSTKTVLENLPWGRQVKRGTYFCLDEWHGYEGCEEHEQRAWKEFADKTGITWEVVGHSFQQWAVRITGVGAVANLV